jgi:hypothetical protein
MKGKLTATALVIWGLFCGAATVCAQQGWIRTDTKDPLTDFSYVRFTLDGKFLQAPSSGKADKPTLVVECDPTKIQLRGTIHGKVLRSFITIGTVLDSQVSTHEGLLVTTTQSLVPVMYRRDDEKKIQHDSWAAATNYSALFLGFQAGFIHDNGEVHLGELFYGHGVTHVEGKGEQVRKLVISVPEYLGGDVVMQFDLPDLTSVSDSCGLIEHKR